MDHLCEILSLYIVESRHRSNCSALQPTPSPPRPAQLPRKIKCNKTYQALSEENKALSQSANASRALLAQRGQELADVTAKATADAASSRRLLQEAEDAASAEKAAALSATADATRQLAEAAAAARDVDERHAKETGET